MKRTATAVALTLAGLLLTACGGAEPSAAPTQTVTVDSNGQVIPEPVVTVTVDAVETTPAEDCWTALPFDHPDSWQTRYNAAAASDVDAALVILESLPDPSEGCTAEDVTSLESAKNLRDTWS